MRPVHFAAVLMLAGAVVRTDGAMAQTMKPGQSDPGRPSEPPAQKQTGQSGEILSGPPVEQTADGEGPGFGSGDRRRQRPITVPFGQWIGIVSATKLTEEQSARVRTIAQEFQQASRDFNQKHGKELQSLREQTPGRARRAA